MAQARFTNLQLVTVWSRVAQSKGTRRDVIETLMKEIGLDPANDVDYGKIYNSVVQRVRALSSGDSPLTFPDLAETKHKGRSKASIDELQAILTPADEGDSDEPADHPASTDPAKVVENAVA